jgi:hypothetical protein
MGLWQGFVGDEKPTHYVYYSSMGHGISRNRTVAGIRYHTSYAYIVEGQERRLRATSSVMKHNFGCHKAADIREMKDDGKTSRYTRWLLSNDAKRNSDFYIYLCLATLHCNPISLSRPSHMVETKLRVTAKVFGTTTQPHSAVGAATLHLSPISLSRFLRSSFSVPLYHRWSFEY